MRRALPAAVALLGVLLAPAVSGRAATPAGGQPARAAAGMNRMHPAFAVLDSAGVPVQRSRRPASAERTCGSCHDAEYINTHNGHWNARVRATCVQCHWQGGSLPTEPAALDADGKLRRGDIRISTPQDANCGACHGLVHAGADPLAVPADFGAPASPDRDYGFTLHTGAVFSGQNLSDSHLNLQDKSGRAYPWDVHARRLVRCVDCHFAANDPTRRGLQHTRVDFLIEDPRRISLSEFLNRPDHRLATATCRTCHDPMQVHDFLPYKRRHLDALECQSCHVPHPMGPAAQMIDETVVRPDGAPVVVYRGMEPREGGTLSTAFAAGYTPLLLAGSSAAGTPRLGPYNAVDRWYWASARTDQAVPLETVRRAYLDSGRYADAVRAVFDADHDGTVAAAELRLDSPGKTERIAARLRALGVADPVIRHAVTLYPLEHGVVAGPEVERDCSSCHAGRSRLRTGLPLATYAPGGGPAAVAAVRGGPPGTEVRLVAAKGGTWIETRIPGESRLYVFGNTRRSWVNRLGFSLVFAVLAGVLIHGAFRFLRHPRVPAHAAPRQRVYIYRTYERVWHWLMAMSILALVITGLQVEFAGTGTLLPLPLAVRIHNFFAIVLTANAFLSLFYHLAAGAIRQFIPPRKGLAQHLTEQVRYYTRGILLGRPQPSPRSVERKLNPLQQLTYLALLNVLFPFQVLTGALIWGSSRWPQLAAAVGGLTVVAPLHALGAWLFLAFFILHLYLTTTGHTVLSHIGAMIDGYEELEREGVAPSGGSHA